MTAIGKPGLGVAMIGHGFMGAAHSAAWRSAPRFFDLPLEPRMVIVAGRDSAAVSSSAAKYGWAESTTDWRALLTREDVDLVDICTPGDSHAEIAIAALEAGKHVLIEKPLANTEKEAQRIVEAARAAESRGVRAMVGFSYRRTPALALAAHLVRDGAIGKVRQVRAQYLQDWLVDDGVPMSWRLDRALAGSGALGDLGTHLIDAAGFVTGLSIEEVSGTMTTFVAERPLSGRRSKLGGSSDASADAPRGTVTVDDAAVFTARFEGGALGSFEVTRMATGRKNAFRLEVSGTEGAVFFDFENMNSLEVYERGQKFGEGFRRILVTEPEHPYLDAWWPAGHGLGYEHLFTHQVVDFVHDIAAGRRSSPDVDQGLAVQRVLAAVERSASAAARWQRIEIHNRGGE